jgi:mRNA-degrading endonuclease toxin of MazEF toxin-antitoxin module
MNKALNTVIVVPLTRSKKDWSTRVNIDVKGTESQACLEHIRSVSKERFIEKMCVVNFIEMVAIRKHLGAIFSE